MSQYHKQSKLFDMVKAHVICGVQYYTLKGLAYRFIDEWRDQYADELNGRKVRITIEIEPSPEDRKRD